MQNIAPDPTEARRTVLGRQLPGGFGAADVCGVHPDGLLVVEVAAPSVVSLLEVAGEAAVSSAESAFLASLVHRLWRGINTNSFHAFELAFLRWLTLSKRGISK